MRRIALSLLVAATGCNWVFGLHKTQPADAPPDTPDGPPDAPFLKMVFEYQVGTTDSSGAPMAGAPIAISPPPTIELGAMGGMLSPATYDAATRTFIVPFDLPGNPWRLVYQLANDPVPTEIQWSANTAHLTLPSLQRAGDTPPPAGSGWDFKPTPTPSIATPRVLTSGAFTFTQLAPGDLVNGGKEVAFPFATEAKGLLSAVGTPKVASGDWALLYDYRFLTGSIPNTQYGAAGYAWVQADLAAGSLTTVTPAWVTSTSVVSTLNWSDLPNRNRMGTISSLGGTCCTFQLEYGILPSPNIPPFLPSPTGVDRTSLVDLFVQTDNTTEPISITVNDPPTTEIKQPRMFLAAFTAPRTAYGVTLTNTLQTLGSAKTFAFAGPLATSVTFGGVTLMNGSADNQSIPASTSTISLRWMPESSASITLSADDFVVTLYEIANSTLTPIRHYQVLAPRVEVDGNLLAKGHRYVFGITSRSGFPNAAQGDYSMVTLPFSETTTFPLAFVIN